jgi:hypothetical protein
MLALEPFEPAQFCSELGDREAHNPNGLVILVADFFVNRA